MTRYGLEITMQQMEDLQGRIEDDALGGCMVH